MCRPSIILHTETNKCLKVIQETQIINGLHKPCVVFFDESAITALGAEHQQVLPGQGRASNVLGAAAGKERITTGIFRAADGAVPPSFNIIRCASTKADMSRVKVISELHKAPGFTVADGWQLRVWRQDVMIKGKDGVLKLIKCARPYLIHTDGTVITCQSKAWMDQICLMMMGELSVLPYLQKAAGEGRRVIDVGAILGQIVYDNCPSHVVLNVINYYLKLGIIVTLLPKNMTPKLQLGDLIQNKGEKAHCRRRMLDRIFDAFQEFLAVQQATGRPPEDWPAFVVPTTTTAVLLLDIISVWRDSVLDNKLRNSLAEGAWKYAQAPHPETGPGTGAAAVFNIYVSHDVPPQRPTVENIAWMKGNIHRETRLAAAEKAADDSRIERTSISVINEAEINTFTVSQLKDAIRARNNWMVVNGKPIKLSGNKLELVTRLVEYERRRSAPAAADGAGVAVGLPGELDAEDARQLVGDLVGALEFMEEDDDNEEAQEGDSVDCDGDDDEDDSEAFSDC